MTEVTFEQCLPTEREGPIKDLFARVGQPEFATVFERAYRVRERSGLRSWVGNTGTRAVLHISVSPQEFSDGNLTLRAGVLGDLMADETQRDFWGPLKLARQMVSDVRNSGALDLLLTTYTETAEAVFRAAGFKPFGVLRRHVMPLLWPWQFYKRLRHGETAPALVQLAYDDPAVAELLSALPSPGLFRPRPEPDFYLTRMPRHEYPAGIWLVAGGLERPEGAVLVSPVRPGELIVADILWRHGTPAAAGLLSATARWARKGGYSRLSIGTLENAPLAAAAVRAGFVPRPDAMGLKILVLGAAGAVPPLERWWVTTFMGTAW
jgi:GNAT superfamily N-acetyltransferase